MAASLANRLGPGRLLFLGPSSFWPSTTGWMSTRPTLASIRAGTSTTRPALLVDAVQSGEPLSQQPPAQRGPREPARLILMWRTVLH